MHYEQKEKNKHLSVLRKFNIILILRSGDHLAQNITLIIASTVKKKVATKMVKRRTFQYEVYISDNRQLSVFVVKNSVVFIELVPKQFETWLQQKR